MAVAFCTNKNKAFKQGLSRKKMILPNFTYMVPFGKYRRGTACSFTLVSLFSSCNLTKRSRYPLATCKATIRARDQFLLVVCHTTYSDNNQLTRPCNYPFLSFFLSFYFFFFRNILQVKTNHSIPSFFLKLISFGCLGAQTMRDSLL